MLQLEDLKRGARITGIVPQGAVTVVDVHRIGSTAVELTYKTPAGQVANQLLYHDSEPTLALVAAGAPGPLTTMERSSVWSRKRTVSAWPISSIPGWLSRPPWWTRSRTRSPLSTSRCCPANPCAICWPTIRGRGRPS